MCGPSEAYDPRRAPRSVRRVTACLASAATAGALLVGAFALPAAAAGDGYGGAPVLPRTGIPGGFRTVVSAVSISRSGRVVHEVLDRVSEMILVPKGSTRSPEQIVVTRPNLKAIKRTLLKDVPTRVRRDKAIYGLGFVFDRRNESVTNSKFATITLTSKLFSRKDYVVVYSAKQHGFVPAPRGTARCVKDHVVVRFRTGNEFVVMGR